MSDSNYHEISLEILGEMMTILVGYDYAHEEAQECVDVFEAIATRKRKLGFKLESGGVLIDAVSYRRLDILPVLSPAQILCIEKEILELIHTERLRRMTPVGPVAQSVWEKLQCD